MGGAVSAGEDNDELIDKLVNAEYIKSPSVECIFRAVDRGFYYLPTHRFGAYRDQAWRCNNLHLSAPCIYSEIMEALQIKPGLSFLNIGSGTGYLSTLVGLMLGSKGINHGIELHSEVVKYAQNKLQEFLSNSPALYRYDFAEPSFVLGNAITVLSEDPIKHQYDRVYCGAAVPSELEFFMKSLLKINGILVMPFNDQLVQVTRKSVSEYDTKIILPVNFATLVTPSTGMTGSGSSSGSSSNSSYNSHQSRTVKDNKATTDASEDDSCGKMYQTKLPELHPSSLKVICRLKVLQLLRSSAELEIKSERGTSSHLKTQATKKRVMSKIARKVSQRLSAPIFEESSDMSTRDSTSSSVDSRVCISSDEGISDSDKSSAGCSSNDNVGTSSSSQTGSSNSESELNSSDASQGSSKLASGDNETNDKSDTKASSSDVGDSNGGASSSSGQEGPFTEMFCRLETIIGSASSISHVLQRFIHSGLDEEPSSSSTSSSASSSPSSSPVTSGQKLVNLASIPVKEFNVAIKTNSNEGDAGKASSGSSCSNADSGIASTSSAMESSCKRSISVTGEFSYLTFPFNLTLIFLFYLYLQKKKKTLMEKLLIHLQIMQMVLLHLSI